ncbi:MAG TPA: cupin domain-containing protein [Steroidobacteraceae bacterium]
MSRPRGAWQQSAPREGTPAARVRARLSWHEYLCGAFVSTAIIPLDGRVEAEVSELPSGRLLAGTPELLVRNFFTDASQQFFAGRWSATRGKWRVRYTENELCVMTSGRVTIESATGERRSFGPGDAFVVPAGFAGTWEVVEDCSKIYAVFEAHG